MENKILEMLRGDARLSAEVIAKKLGINTEKVATTIAHLEDRGIIRGYTAIINKSELNSGVRALIEVRVTPQRDGGFDKIAQRIAKFPEVIDLFLVSGSCDLLIAVEGKSLQTVANFVAAKLATIEGVISTATSFQLKKYKEAGIIMRNDENYERIKIIP